MKRTSVYIASLILALGSSAFAAKAKVVKVSGNKAVIQFPSGMEIQNGQVLNIGDDGEDLGGGSSSGHHSGGRTYSIGATLDYSSMAAKLKTSSGLETDGNKVSTLNLDLRLGYNLGTFEVGPKLLYENTTTTPPAGGTETDTTTTGFGAFAEYNFMPNKIGTGFVPALFGEVAFGGTTTKAGTAETKTSLTQFDFGVAGKLFALSDTGAVRLTLGYRMQSGSSSAGGVDYTITNSGIVFGAGLQQYF